MQVHGVCSIVVVLASFCPLLIRIFFKRVKPKHDFIVEPQ